MSLTAEQIYDLMPALYRLKDLEQPTRPLQTLLEIISEQAGVLQRDIEQLYDDLFIETCQPWVVPYVGDLVATNLAYDSRIADRQDTAGSRFRDLAGAPDLRPSLLQFRARADVARTIFYRRRKGTLVMLEGLARDVTGWPVHVVEFMQSLGWTQDLEHLRPQVRWTDIRSLDGMRRIGGAYDPTAHTVDVRPINQDDGWYGIHKVGFFVWRLRSYALKQVVPAQGPAAWAFSFSPLGNPTPLFTPWTRQVAQGQLVTEREVPTPIRPTMFYEDLLSSHSVLYGDVDQGASFGIYCDGQLQPVGVITCRNLETWPATQPADDKIAVDVARGRLVLGTKVASCGLPTVSFHYGFPADLGGGSYDRSRWLVVGDQSLPPTRYQVESGVAAGGTKHPDLVGALNAWLGDGKPDAVITIEDSQRYTLPSSISLADQAGLAIEAADGERPVLGMAEGFAALEVTVVPTAAVDRGASLTLSGVVVEGYIHVTGDLRRLRLLHSTLVPGRALGNDGKPRTAAPPDNPSLVVDATQVGNPINLQLEVEVAFSITGPLRLPQHSALLLVLDSIIDGLGNVGVAESIGGGNPAYGPPARIERSTLLGGCWLRQLDPGSESIFAGGLNVARTQRGCVRFSFIGALDTSRTPRRYRCQPDLAISAESALHPDRTQAAVEADVMAWLLPSFASIRFGRPDYVQLRLGCPVAISRGSEDGAEMGAYNHLKQPQRESNLRLRLDEYLPFGLDAGIIYVT